MAAGFAAYVAAGLLAMAGGYLSILIVQPQHALTRAVSEANSVCIYRNVNMTGSYFTTEVQPSNSSEGRALAAFLLHGGLMSSPLLRCHPRRHLALPR